VELQIVTRYYLPVKAGVETHCREIATRAHAMGHSVTVITRDDGFGLTSPLPAREVVEGIPVVRCSSSMALSKEIRPGIPVYLNNFDTSLTFFLFSRALWSRVRRRRIPIWLVPHGGFTPYWGQFSFLKRAVKKVYHRTLGAVFINRLTCGVSALNAWERDQLVQAGIREDKIVVRTNGVEDIAFEFPPLHLQGQGFSELEEKEYFLMLCRISREKNLDRVIKALSRLERVTLVIAGAVQDQPFYDELQSLINEMGLKERVIFAGYVSGERKYALVDSSAAVVLLSLYESDSIVIKEALVRGKPVVASRVGPLPSMISQGENGYLADPTDEEAIASALAAVLVLSPEQRGRMEETNKKKGIQYGWGAVTAALLNDIQKCEGGYDG
jgi:glycosyltransferase involved in cell wall biosynthesis